jgi:hypothetical protein
MAEKFFCLCTALHAISKARNVEASAEYNCFLGFTVIAG